jgi:hypothetical protein
MLTPHSIIHGDACFAYFNKIWGIPPATSMAFTEFRRQLLVECHFLDKPTLPWA